MNALHSTTKLWIGAIAISAAAAAIIALLSIPSSSPQSPECPPDIDELIGIAEKLQAERRWCEANTAWTNAKDAITQAGEGACPQKATLAGSNVQLLAALCDDSTKADEKSVEVKRMPVNPISGKDLLLYYPKDRQVRTLGLFSIKGRSEGTDWGLKARSYFRYVHEFEAVWTVEQNDEKQVKDHETVIFSVHLARVEETMAMSQSDIDFAPIDDPALVFAWGAIGQPLLRRTPGYQLIAGAWDAGGNAVAKTALNWAVGQFKSAKALAQPDVWVVEQVSRLNGLKLRLKFQNGLGITRIEVIENPGGAPITKPLLTSLADDLNPLMDYEIFPGDEEKADEGRNRGNGPKINERRKVGAEWDVQSHGLSGLSAVGGDLTLDGKLRIRREPDTIDGKVAAMSIESGKLQLKSTHQDADQQADVIVDGGKLQFDIERKLVVSGDLTIHGRGTFESKNHLVFKTSRVSDVEMKSRYAAKRVK
jgi:hypothetical protein